MIKRYKIRRKSDGKFANHKNLVQNPTFGPIGGEWRTLPNILSCIPSRDRHASYNPQNKPYPLEDCEIVELEYDVVSKKKIKDL